MQIDYNTFYAWLGLAGLDLKEVDGTTYDSFGNLRGSGSTRYTYTGRELDQDIIQTPSSL